MNDDLRSALANAMTRLKTADVSGATAAIQRALSGRSPAVQPTQGADRGHGGARRLGDVLGTLKAIRGHDRSAGIPVEPNASIRSDPRFQARQFGSHAGSCSYKLYVPTRQDRGHEGLVVMLHGCTQDPDDFARGTRMNVLAEEFGLVVAYPHQPRTANAQGCWNWFDVRHQGSHGGEPAVLAALALSLAEEFSIAATRVFVAGLSAGGAMADILSTTHPQVFAAAGVHSGLPRGAARDVMTAFAAMKGNAETGYAKKGRLQCRMIIFHGADDATVHPRNGARVFANARSDQGHLQELKSDSEINGKRVTRTRLVPSAGAAVAEFWEIHGGGHAWSGGDRSGTFADPKGPDASREMIRFFLES